MLVVSLYTVAVVLFGIAARLWKTLPPKPHYDDDATVEHFVGYLHDDAAGMPTAVMPRFVEPDFVPTVYSALDQQQLDEEWAALQAGEQAAVVNIEPAEAEPAHTKDLFGRAGATEDWSPAAEVEAAPTDYYEQSATDQQKIDHSELAGIDAALLQFSAAMNALTASICHDAEGEHDPVMLNNVYALREPTMAFDISQLFDDELVAA